MSVFQDLLNSVLSLELFADLLSPSQHLWALDYDRLGRVIVSYHVSSWGFDIGRLTVAHRNAMRNGLNIGDLTHAFPKLLIFNNLEFPCHLVLDIKLI